MQRAKKIMRKTQEFNKIFHQSWTESPRLRRKDGSKHSGDKDQDMKDQKGKENIQRKSYQLNKIFKREHSTEVEKSQ